MSDLAWGPAVRLPLTERVRSRVGDGARFAALIASERDSSTELMAVLSDRGSLILERMSLPPGFDRYPSVSRDIPSALWYEREIHDLFGISPVGSRDLEPLVLPLTANS